MPAVVIVALSVSAIVSLFGLIARKSSLYPQCENVDIEYHGPNPPITCSFHQKLFLLSIDPPPTYVDTTSARIFTVKLLTDTKLRENTKFF